VKVKAVAQLLEQDAMLTAVTMRAANSAVHRGSSEICTLEEAIARMGLRRVTDLFLETAVTTRVFHAPGYEPVMDLLRVHSAGVAHVARMASRFTGLDGGHAFLCGLLHDVGLAAGFIAIGEQHDTSNKPAIDVVWPAVLQHHMAAGRLLQQSWALPDEVGEVLAQHHVHSSATRLAPLACLVALADALVAEQGAAVLNETAAGTIEVTSAQLGIDDHILRKISSNAGTIVTNLLAEPSH
jgi:HD-like signal output (HDOD) protein